MPYEKLTLKGKPVTLKDIADMLPFILCIENESFDTRLLLQIRVCYYYTQELSPKMAVFHIDPTSAYTEKAADDLLAQVEKKHPGLLQLVQLIRDRHVAQLKKRLGDFV